MCGYRSARKVISVLILTGSPNGQVEFCSNSQDFSVLTIAGNLDIMFENFTDDIQISSGNIILKF